MNWSDRLMMPVVMKTRVRTHSLKNWGEILSRAHDLIGESLVSSIISLAGGSGKHKWIRISICECVSKILLSLSLKRVSVK